MPRRLRAQDDLAEIQPGTRANLAIERDGELIGGSGEVGRPGIELFHDGCGSGWVT